MNKYVGIFIALFFVVTSSSPSIENSGREEILFDADWRFMREEVPGAEKTTFDDSSWRILDLPHDYSIEDVQGTDSPFHPEAISAVNGGFTTGGTAWYRKTFDVPGYWKGKTLKLLFEGVYMNADVWINGVHLGSNIYGYTPFYFDVTEHVNWGEKNIVAVQVKNEGVNSRWYTGSGIYRHVWLKVLDPIHIVENGIYITTPHITSEEVMVKIETSVRSAFNKEEIVRIITEIIDPNGNIVARKESKKILKTGENYTFSQNIAVDKPLLWSPDSPLLYSATTKLISDISEDTKHTTFGIRNITMDAKNGFMINGFPMKLKGGCVHHDNGPLGSKAFDRAEERRVELLKANGFNSVRCAHNPPSVAFLDACDKLGLLVIDEAFDMWDRGKNSQDYHLFFNEDWQNSLSSMVKRDRNHPSIFLWSIGNEIRATSAPETIAISRKLGDFVHSLDSTRPITAGVHGLDGDIRNYLETFEVSGLNYAILPGCDYYAKYAIEHPDMVMYGSESYPMDAFDAWVAVEKYPFVIGDYVWTAFDYIGEASIGWHGYPQNPDFYPWNLAYDADIDICGWKRPQSYYRDAFWKNNNITIAVHPPVPSFELSQIKKEDWSRWHYDDVVFDWNWNGYEGTLIQVDIYSTSKEVELFLNGKSVGRKTVGKENKNKVSYMVPYEKGELKAVGYDNDGQTIKTALNSAGVAKIIKMTPDRTQINVGGQDLSFVTIELLDANGVLNPKAENQLHFTLEGDASIVAVGNAKPNSIESYTKSTRRAWRGKCLVIIKSGYTVEDIILTAKADRLEDVSVKLHIY